MASAGQERSQSASNTQRVVKGQRRLYEMADACHTCRSSRTKILATRQTVETLIWEGHFRDKIGGDG